ncbi:MULTISPECIES: hypothetical protein [Bacillaceae]|nr:MULTISPECIES: hypothetical protein [Bacillaceae]
MVPWGSRRIENNPGWEAAAMETEVMLQLLMLIVMIIELARLKE